MKPFTKYFTLVAVLMVAPTSFAANQSIKFNSNELNVAGEFPVNSHPLIISGFHNLEKAYKLEIQTQKQTGNIFKVTYSLYRGEKLDKSGSIITAKNQPGEISTKEGGQTKPAITFKVTISD